ncbi:MAG: DUF350 domain-containing protein [Methanoregulaceae archaeon]
MALLLNAGIGLFQLFLSVILAVLALYIAFTVFHRITRNINEIQELAKGNIALGILIATLFIAVGLVVQSGVQGVVLGLGQASSDGLFTQDGAIDIIMTIVQLILGVVLAIGSIYLALRIFDRVTGKTGEFEEIKKGNLAMAIVLSGMIFAIAVIIHSGIIGITAALR